MSDNREEKEMEHQEETPIILCDNLVKLFKTKDVEVMALQGLDLTVNRGEMISVIGKSGSGKSTLMNIIGGLETPSAGQITVAGQALSDMTEREMVRYRKKTIGFVWQKSGRNLFPYLTALENIEFPMSYTKRSGRERKKRAMQLIELVGMAHKKDSYPMQMSGGEQQRIAIAVALANEPEVLLADEPTGAVDSKTSAHILSLFRTLNKSLHLTIIIVTHDLKLAEQVDRVLMISDGKIGTEKIIRDQYREKMDELAHYEDTHEEFSVLDKARRVQLSEEMLAEAGIDSNKVKISVEDGRVVIVGEKS